MNMYKIRGSLANCPGHSWTDRNRRYVKGRAGSGHPNPAYQFIRSPPVVARDNHPHIYRPLKLLTQGLKMRLHATHVRRVELTELEHTQPRAAHTNNPAFDDTKLTTGPRQHVRAARQISLT